jgi:hypothetical protein
LERRDALAVREARRAGSHTRHDMVAEHVRE